MFKEGDKVVCIRNCDDENKVYDTIIGDIYEIVKIRKGIYAIDYDYVEVIGSIFLWETYNFMTISDYIKEKRAEKLKHLDECSKKEIK